MQTWDGAGFGEQPNAAARRLLSRALWVGGLAVAGSVLAAASASAAESGRADGPAGDPFGSPASEVEPVTGAADALVTEAGTLLPGERTPTEDSLNDEPPAGGAEVSGLVERPVEELVERPVEELVERPVEELVERPVEEPADSAAGPRESRVHASAGQEGDADRDAAIETHSDRRMRRGPVHEAAGGEDAADAATGTGPERELGTLIGTVDRSLTTADVVPDVDEAVPGDDSSAQSFTAQKSSDLLGAVTDLVTLLDSSAVVGGEVLEPVAPLPASFGPAANLGPAADPQDTARAASAAHSTLTPAPNTPAVGPLRTSFDETVVARPAGKDGESAVINSSLDAGTDGRNPSGRTRGVLRPSLLVTPVAGPSALHVGATGAATSADQAGPSSHALLPEEAVLRARLFSAAAYARDVGAKPLREANDPPVTPD